jgi:hypothetical protein
VLADVLPVVLGTVGAVALYVLKRAVWDLIRRKT